MGSVSTHSGSIVEALESKQFLSVTPTDPAPGVPVHQQIGHGVHFTAYEDTTYHGKVGSFKADLTTSGLTLRLNIDWGDGKSSDGKIEPNTHGGYDIIGTHTYVEDGKYDVHAVVTAGPRVIPGRPNPFFFIQLANVDSKADVKDLKPVSYHRSSWIPDLQLDITVTPNGLLTFSAPTIRTRPVQLTEAQEDKLRAAFAGWEKLKRNYPNPPIVADANDVTIGYGGKLVTVGDAVMNPPAAFRAVQMLLEKFAGLGG